MKRLQKYHETPSFQEWIFSSFEDGGILIVSDTCQPRDGNGNRSSVRTSHRFEKDEFEALLHFLQSNFLEATKE